MTYFLDLFSGIGGFALGTYEVERPENYRFYINGNASTAAIIELAAIKTLIHKNFACCNWKKEVVNNFGIAYHRKSKEAQK